ncbi:UNVERIFIED_ORG: glycosyltransferase involved in cell wall biosynthesis [Arthrobacter sp. UYEF10]
MTKHSEPEAIDMHIAFVVNNYPPKAGGVEFHVAALAGALVNAGVKVTVFALENSGKEATESGVHVVRLHCTRMIGNVLAFPLPGTRRIIQQRIKDLNVDAISVHTRFFPMTYIGVRIARALQIPAILTEHGSDHVRGVSPIIGAASKLVDFTVGRYVLRNSARVLAISESAQSFVWRLASVRSEVFRNAIDVNRFVEKDSVPNAVAKIVFLGRLVPGKGWQRVLEVAETLSQEGLAFEVHFIGDGPDRPALDRASNASLLAERITVHGRLTIEEIAIHLQNAILLNPTDLAEGFQTTLLEAIACQASIVSTPVAAAEYLRDLGAQIDIVASEDSAGWIERTRELLQNISYQARPELLSEFDWSVRGQEYVEILNMAKK